MSAIQLQTIPLLASSPKLCMTGQQQRKAYPTFFVCDWPNWPICPKLVKLKTAELSYQEITPVSRGLLTRHSRSAFQACIAGITSRYLVDELVKFDTQSHGSGNIYSVFQREAAHHGESSFVILYKRLYKKYMFLLKKLYW